MPAQESVDDLAKLEQITELAERRCAVHIVLARRCVGIAPVSPRGGNERSAAVRQDDEREQNAASLLLITGSVCPSNAWRLRVTVT
jgi:hypothetical protein